jgi:hypothetical protein
MVKATSAEQLVQDFWARVGNQEPFPRQLERSIMLTMPVFVVKVHRHRLDTQYICNHLRHRQVPIPANWTPRRLNGCLIAYKGEAAIFVDGTLSPEDVRVIIAHEFGHYLADYEWPRSKAVRHLGNGILAVLDGARPPSRSEVFAAALADVRIGFYMHYMDRSECSKSKVLVSHVEETADLVGAELLAPRKLVFATIKKTQRAFSQKICARLLADKFGLPRSYAAWYAARLAASERRTRSFTEILGF